MSSTTEHFLALQEERYECKRSEWIRSQLGNPEATESTEGWNELADEYDEKYEQWNDYMEEHLNWLKSQNHTTFFRYFLSSIEELKGVLVTSSSYPGNSNLINKMAYIHAVTLLETYLGDTLKNIVLSKPIFMERAVNKFEGLNTKKFTLRAILADTNIIARELDEFLSEQMYHNIIKIMNMYKAVFEIEIDYDKSMITKIVNNRHDLVHRNGKDKNNKPIDIDKVTLDAAISHIHSFVSSVDEVVNQQHQKSFQKD
ncbi:HEPN domain-containing protein [Alteromonas sp. ASW11-36]|uniref:HEPN domain-containing protein n=1 Tax=Alteromonas arenosi TaxID=3055817 RepID=A0ABT7SWJ5_9ALTE|nr:HEPN domain-containing protein [Alteromonas sp. ASW11-36]MDM7860561.1 HEPN domain-containing protein [Alteromonas sp. ASW11-36]